MAVLEFCSKNWFLIGIVLVIFAAFQEPDFGKKGGNFNNFRFRYEEAHDKLKYRSFYNYIKRF